jgi:hypothetical protein
MEALISHCTAAFALHRGFFAVFFLGGVTGSLTHCLVMCGPVVACESACGGGCGKKMSVAAQWQYHLGRLLTYGGLGFFTSFFSKQLVSDGYWQVFSAVMMFVAGFLFLLSSVFQNRHALLKYSPKNGFLRGVLMSFMPCGLIYAALMMAATLSNPLLGMFAMWFFVLGTIPALLFASGSAVVLAMKWQETISKIGRLGMAFNGLTLLVMAEKMMR